MAHQIDIVRLGDDVQKQMLFQRSSVVVHTSRWEGLPLTLLEALALGRPLLVTPETNQADHIGAASPTTRRQRLAELRVTGIDDLHHRVGNVLRLALSRFRGSELA